MHTTDKLPIICGEGKPTITNTTRGRNIPNHKRQTHKTIIKPVLIKAKKNTPKLRIVGPFGHSYSVQFYIRNLVFYPEY